MSILGHVSKVSRRSRSRKVSTHDPVIRSTRSQRLHQHMHTIVAVMKTSLAALLLFLGHASAGGKPELSVRYVYRECRMMLTDVERALLSCCRHTIAPARISLTKRCSSSHHIISVDGQGWNYWRSDFGHYAKASLQRESQWRQYRSFN